MHMLLQQAFEVLGPIVLQHLLVMAMRDPPLSAQTGVLSLSRWVREFPSQHLKLMGSLQQCMAERRQAGPGTVPSKQAVQPQHQPGRNHASLLLVTAEHCPCVLGSASTAMGLD